LKFACQLYLLFKYNCSLSLLDIFRNSWVTFLLFRSIS
jgi:hypothetical protein